MKCTKAIIPVAGYGSRRLPITKAIEKCMLPVGNRPVVDYVVEDCIKAGVTDVIFVVSEQFEQLQTFYGRNQLLEEYLAEKGRDGDLQELIDLSKKANFHYVVQDQHHPYGTAVPVALCADMINQDEQVLVLMGDDFIYSPDGSSEVRRLLDAVESSGATAGLLAAHVPKEKVQKYGVIDMHTHSGKEFFKKIIEKPSPQNTPSNLINISKYLFDHDLMRAVQKVIKNDALVRGGEYYVTDALDLYVDNGKPITVVPITGQYLDGGSVEGWLYANNVVLGSSE